MNDFIVLNDLSICHCSLYAETTSLSGKSVLVTMRNLPAITQLFDEELTKFLQRDQLIKRPCMFAELCNEHECANI